MEVNFELQVPEEFVPDEIVTGIHWLKPGKPCLHSRHKRDINS
jgi:hypothetical protein